MRQDIFIYAWINYVKSEEANVTSTKKRTKLWYWRYQALVRTLPSIGTMATKHWY